MAQPSLPTAPAEALHHVGLAAHLMPASDERTRYAVDAAFACSSKIAA